VDSVTKIPTCKYLGLTEYNKLLHSDSVLTYGDNRKKVSTAELLRTQISNIPEDDYDPAQHDICWVTDNSRSDWTNVRIDKRLDYSNGDVWYCIETIDPLSTYPRLVGVLDTPGLCFRRTQK